MAEAVPTHAESTTATPEQLAADNAALRAQVAALTRQLEWFKRQLFGPTSERRAVDASATADLFAEGQAPATAPAPEEEITYRRRKGTTKDRGEALIGEGLRFDERVPVETIEVPAPEFSGPDADRWTVIDTKTTYRLAQRPGSYVVLAYRRPVLRERTAATVRTPPAPTNVLEGSLADVSLLAGLVVDKCCYHLPLYRQHQRLADAGIRVSRATLTNLAARTAELLAPIAEAQHAHTLESRVLAMDETPIKAGRHKAKGKMAQGWHWPIYGEADEISFTYAAHRGSGHVHQQLQGFAGTLLSDGYSAYARFAEATEGLTHAQCWAHTRRKFLAAEASEPEAAAAALAHIRDLYRIEAAIRDRRLEPDKALAYQAEHARPRVDAFFAWVWEQRQRADLLPSNPLAKALAYAHEREGPLRVFLGDAAVPLDTNHLERALRVIPLGRKNWHFCWTEMGAQHVATLQSLLSTCRLQDVNPYTYLVDVLQRISRHPARDIIGLTPRVWKERFAHDPLTSDVEDHGG